MSGLDLARLGNVLKALRGEQSQMDIERATGVPQYVLSKLERGDIDKPSFDYIIRLANHYGLTPDHLAAAAGAIPAPSAEWEEENLSRALSTALRLIRSIAMQLDETEQHDFAIRLEMALDAQRRDLLRTRTEEQQDAELPGWLKSAILGR